MCICGVFLIIYICVKVYKYTFIHVCVYAVSMCYDIYIDIIMCMYGGVVCDVYPSLVVITYVSVYT